MTNSLEISVRAEYTPNPNSLKFVCSETLYPFGGSLSYEGIDSAKAAENQMAIKLLEIEGLTKVFIMSNFVTAEKKDETNWKDIHLEIKNIIKTSIEDLKDWCSKNKPEESTQTEETSNTRTQIENVLNKIRPALAADGGNIEYVDLIGKDLRLRMVGACGTCPSALMTMKMGVERAMLAELPDLVETVTQVF